MKTLAFLKDVVSSKDPSSAKRVVTLMVSFHFILASFVILYICSYVIFSLPRGRVDPELVALLRDVLEYDMYIILGGLGFIGLENFGNSWVERARAKGMSNMFPPPFPMPQQYPPDEHLTQNPQEPKDI